MSNIYNTLGNIPSTKIEEIQNIEYLKCSCYSGVEPIEAISHFYKRYINPLENYIDLDKVILADCGCGYGWLAFAFILSGGKYALCIDPDFRRLEAAKEISEILNIDEKIAFICASISHLPFLDQTITVFASIETLQHIWYNGKPSKRLTRKGIQEMSRVTQKYIIVKTPNNWFPIDHHDTGLPFAHWLPQVIRTMYAKLFHRTKYEYTNRFISHRFLEKYLKEFKLITSFRCYSDVDEWIRNRPVYSPHGIHIGYVPKINKNNFKVKFLKFIFKLLKQRTRYFLPCIEGIYEKRGTVSSKEIKGGEKR